MSSVAITQHQLDREAEGETTLELVAVRYTGPNSMFPVSAHLEAQGWPRAAPMNGGATGGDNGPWYFALMPDEGLGYLENRNDLDVVYGTQREQFAEILLEQRRLPGNVFSRGANRSLQDRVFDTLGLKPQMDAGPIEDQLRDIAGVEATDDDAEGDTVRYRCFDAHCDCSLNPEDDKTTHESDVERVFEVALGIMDCDLEDGWSPGVEDFENGTCMVVSSEGGN